MRTARRFAFVTLATGALAITALSCGGSGHGEVRIFAAASLQHPFEDIGRAYEREHRVTVRFNFAGSQVLRFQIGQGARADVFASADERQMALARQAGSVGDSVVFARNRLVLVVPRDNPGRVTTPADLARPGLRLVLAAPEVPAGAYSRAAIDRLSQLLGSDFARSALANVVSQEEDVERVLTKVRLGEADAGIVYASDVAGEGGRDVRAFALPDAVQPDIAYYIAPVTGGDTAAARTFIDAVRGPAGRSALVGHGFEPVP